MAKKLLLFLFLLISNASIAQQVVSTQGGSYTSENISLDFSIGEPVIQTLSKTENSLTQGVIQPFLALLDPTDFDQLELKIYPNPSSSLIHVKLLNFDQVNYSLYDLQGRRITQGTIDNRFASIDIENLAHGVYLLKLENPQNNKLKTVRIIKN